MPREEIGLELRLPVSGHGPGRKLTYRLAAAIGLLALTAAIAYLDRGGYRDVNGDGISLLDAIYYATVSVTTTGYGDIAPASDSARLLTTIVVTPARVMFLILLVGTTLEVLAEGSRAAFRERIWRRTLRDHIIICGYGTKGRSAIETLRGHGHADDQIVVIDASPAAVEAATRDGHAAVLGDAARTQTLEHAGIREAAAVIIAPDRDDSAVLMTLTARELNPTARITTAVREDENRHLLLQGGADSVITSAAAAGRVLGFAAVRPALAHVLEDLLEVGTGLDLEERDVTAAELGRSVDELQSGQPVIGVLRDGHLLRFDDRRCERLQDGDRLLLLSSNGPATVGYQGDEPVPPSIEP